MLPQTTARSLTSQHSRLTVLLNTEQVFSPVKQRTHGS